MLLTYDSSSAVGARAVPGLEAGAGVGGTVDPETEIVRAGGLALAGADPDDGGIAGLQGHGADALGADGVEDRGPAVAAVGGLPETPGRRTQVEDGLVGRMHGERHRAARHAPHRPAEHRHAHGTHGLPVLARAPQFIRPQRLPARQVLHRLRAQQVGPGHRGEAARLPEPLLALADLLFLAVGLVAGLPGGNRPLRGRHAGDHHQERHKRDDDPGRRNLPHFILLPPDFARGNPRL